MTHDYADLERRILAQGEIKQPEGHERRVSKALEFGMMYGTAMQSPKVDAKPVGPTPEQIGSMVTGFLAACEFADCGPDADEDLQSADWSDEARSKARDTVTRWAEAVGAEDFAEAVQVTVGHQDFDFDVCASIGCDIYYDAVGHGVGFTDRDEYEPEFAERLAKAARELGEVWPHAGDDGLRYLG